MIEFNQVSLQRGIKPLLEKADLRIHDGQKLALIGANGAGKSSLFALLLGELGVDQGDLYLPSGWRIAHMAQEVEASQRSAVDYVIDGDKVYREIEHGIETATCDNELANWHSKMDAHNGYNIKVQAEQLLHGLGFKQSDMIKPVSGFSGGWRIRLNLAQALMTPSDLLLLDEPTNHLDLDATLWLEQWLNKYQGTLVFISHDRDFIDGVADHIVHLHQQTLTSYPGNYSAYERIRAERLAQQQVMHDKQQVRIAEIEKFVTRFKAKASKAKQAQSRLKRLQKLPDLAPAHVDSQFTFSFEQPETLPYPLLSLTESQCGYNDEAIILENVEMTLVPGSRIGLLGRNGAGKSTLIKSLAGDLTLLQGQRYCAQELKVGYFSQHQLEQLHLPSSAIEHITRAKPDLTELQARSFLGRFGFSGDQALDKVGTMSGGEKARLVLALIVLEKPQLLLLDEPTNHLDLEMRQALVLALQDFDGAIILIAHDRYLLESCVDEFYLVANGRVTDFDGDIDDYQQWLNDDKKQTVKANKVVSEPQIDKKQQRKEQAELRKKASPLRKQADKFEKLVQKGQNELSEVEARLADSEIYQAEHKAELTTLLKQQAKLTQAIEEHEMEWLDLEEQIEEIMSQAL